MLDTFIYVLLILCFIYSGKIIIIIFFLGRSELSLVFFGRGEFCIWGDMGEGWGGGGKGRENIL